MNHLRKLINSVLKETLEDLNEESLNEGGFEKLMKTMSGDVESVDTIAIMTAENPVIRPNMTAKENKERRKAFEADLRSLGLGFRKAQGQYEGLENSYIVPNMNFEDAVQLGHKYEQDSVIFGKKTEKNNKMGMEFSMLTTDEEQRPTEHATGWVELPDETEDYYTQYKGRKFSLDF